VGDVVSARAVDPCADQDADVRSSGGSASGKGQRRSEGSAPAQQRTVLPPDIPQKFIPARARGKLLYQPVILGAVQTRYMDSKAAVDYVEDVVLAAPVRDDSMPVEWEECFEVKVSPSDLESEPQDGAEFAFLPADAAKAKCYPRLEQGSRELGVREPKARVVRQLGVEAEFETRETEASFERDCSTRAAKPETLPWKSCGRSMRRR
jgi:hypothetical protein